MRNTGDEAVLAGTVRGFGTRDLANPSDFVVFSADPTWTEAIHGVRAAPRMHLRSVRAVLQRSDLLLSGGGSLLQDVTSFRSLLYYVAVLWLARRLGTPYMFFAQGIGPLRRNVSRVLVRRAALQAAALTVRDTGSAQLLERLGVPRDCISVTADPALLLGGENALARKLHPQPVVGLAVRPWEGRDIAGLFVDAVKRLSARGCSVVLLPMHAQLDAPLCCTIASRSGVGVVADPEGNPTRVLEHIQAMDVLLGMRLHALILAAACGVALAGVSYDPKVMAFMARLGLEACTVPIQRASAHEVTGLAEQVLRSREELRRSLVTVLPELRQDALRNVDIAASAVT